MSSETAFLLAIELMDKYGLFEKGWSFKFDNSKKRFGCCNFTKKTIFLSINLVKLNNEADVKDTILHEIAHALVGFDHGHDYVWQRKAKEIGCNGLRCYSMDKIKTPESKYIAKCNGCNRTFKRHKAPKTASQSCGFCSNGRYNPTYKLNWELNLDYSKF